MRDAGLGDRYVEQLEPWRSMLELGQLRRAEGRVPHPLGDIDVRLTRTENDGLDADVTPPPGLEGVLDWRGAEVALTSGRQTLEL